VDNELSLLREEAKKYGELVNSERNLMRPDHYRQLNSLKMVRPPVLVFEEPWGEFTKYKELDLFCKNELYRDIELDIKRCMFKFKYYEADFALHPYFRVRNRIKNSGIGISPDESRISSKTGTEISAHEYHDILPDEESLEKIKMPVIEQDPEATRIVLEATHEVFDGILPVGLRGVENYFNMWDEIPRFHGVENSLIDIYEKPEFMHKMVDKFTQVHERTLDQCEQLNLLETDQYYLHCTPACTYDLKRKDFTKEKVTTKDTWGRGMAQIFAVVSPAMHEEFDLQYMQRLFDRCGLTYYGCCEPLDRKIGLLERFKNLRRISITPWADPDIAADAMGSRYVLSAKSNPAYVSQPVFDPAPVVEETKRILLACRRNNTPCEFILKDISTVSKDVNTLTKWVKTVEDTIDRYWK